MLMRVRFLVTWAFNLVALWVAAALLGGIDYDGFGVLVVASLVFSIVNMFVRPLVILFTLPLVIVSLGLALFFINLLMLYLTSWIVDDFTIDGFWWAFLATIIVWLVNSVLEAFFGGQERERPRPARRGRRPLLGDARHPHVGRAGKLPWFAMRDRTSRPAIVVVLLVLLLAGCGGDDKGDKPQVRANETDMAFATAMLAHHERGIDAAELARTRARDRVIRRSATDLIQLQAVEVQTLRTVRRVLAEAGVAQGDLGAPQSQLDLAAMRRAQDLDRAYADAMIRHHEAALRMSRVEQRTGVHAELRRMAGDIVDLARFQIGQLERRRGKA